MDWRSQVATGICREAQIELHAEVVAVLAYDGHVIASSAPGVDHFQSAEARSLYARLASHRLALEGLAQTDDGSGFALTHGWAVARAFRITGKCIFLVINSRLGPSFSTVAEVWRQRLSRALNPSLRDAPPMPGGSDGGSSPPVARAWVTRFDPDEC